MRRLRLLSRFLQCNIEVARFKIAVGLHRVEGGRLKRDGSGHWNSHYALQLFGLWITLWGTDRDVVDDIIDSWGFSYQCGEACLHLNWRERFLLIHMPWSLDYWRTFVLVDSGLSTERWVRFEKYTKGANGFPVVNEYPEGYYHREGIDFVYRTARGELQRTKAAIDNVEKMQWRWRLFKWLRIPIAARTSYSLSVSFSDEMGGERGSWKSGVIGTGCEYNPRVGPFLSLVLFEEQASKTHTFCR